MFNKKEIFRFILLFMVYILLLGLSSCGSVIMTASSVSEPPPPWFYPNRLEVVRYVYFPEFHFYYDLSARTYLYLDGGIWVRRTVLPPRYRHLNLSRTRYERVKGYRNDNIQRYHEENNANRRSNRNTTRSNRTTKRKNK